MRWRLVICLSVAVVLSTLVTGCGTGGNAPSVPSVPIKVENADNLGGIWVSFQYDSSVLEVTRVKQGALATSRKLTWASPKAGEMQVLMGTGTGISGDGTLLVMKCKVLNSAGSSKLVIQVMEARNAETGELLVTQVSEGSFSASGESVEAPVITFSE